MINFHDINIGDVLIYSDTGEVCKVLNKLYFQLHVTSEKYTTSYKVLDPFRKENESGYWFNMIKTEEAQLLYD